MLYQGIEHLVANTPSVRIQRLFKNINVSAKLEYYNPTFSIKDRVAYEIVRKAYDNHQIKEGDTLIEATSGNTGLGLCVAAMAYNMNLICVLFSDVSYEKIQLMKAYGAQIVMCDSMIQSNEKGGYVWVAKELAKNLDNAYLIDQFNNPLNPLVHYETTGPEIWEDNQGEIDYFVTTIGTGGTISGVGRFLKEKNPFIRVIGVEPVGGLYNPYFNNEPLQYSDHLIHSVSDSFISNNVDFSVIDEVIQVSDHKSFDMCYRLMKSERICAGTSAGCALAGIEQYFSNSLLPEKHVATIFPDCGIKYMDTLFNMNFLLKHKLIEDKPVGFMEEHVIKSMLKEWEVTSKII